MTEYDRFARGNFTSTGNAQFINLPFQPTTVQMWNYSVFSGQTANGVASAYWDAGMGQGFATEYVFNGSGVLTTDVVTTNGISTFSGGLLLQYGPQIQIASIAKASPTVVTTASAHGLSVGQVVILEGLFESSTTGMPQMSLMPFVITAVGSPTTFTITWNSNQSNYTALSGSPTGAYVRQVLYPFLYEPGVNFISAISTGTTTTITTTNNHNYVVGQEIGFRIPSAYGTTQLNELPNNTKPGSPIYYYVTSVTSNTQFVCNANTTGATAFTTNQTVASMVGQSLPQVVAVGDVNSGGTAYSGGALYPSPSFPTSSGGVSTINGPAISGAFVNNTSQGFIIGTGAGTNDTSSVLVGASGNVIYWRATFG
jgi:hypothetical protein